MPKQTKTQLSNELSRPTTTIEGMQKQLKQKTKSYKNKQLIDKPAQMISEQKHAADRIER